MIFTCDSPLHVSDMKR